MGKVVKAVAGVLYKDGMVLIASRPIDKPYAGYWEFPGGKIEADESIQNALIRELHEEIAINTSHENFKHLTFIQQEFAGYTVHLDVILVNNWSGEIKPIEGQTLYWQSIITQCKKEPLLATTVQILNLLKNNAME